MIFRRADQRALHAQRDAVALDALAVDAVAHAHAVLHRLDVNIAGPVADGLGDHRLHQLDDRRLRRVVASRPRPCRPTSIDLSIERSTDLSIDLSSDLVERIAQAVDRAVHRLVDGAGGRRVEQLVQDRS